MNFHRLDGVHQYSGSEPIDISLKVIEEDQARQILAEIESRDPAAWKLMFADERAASWTAAALSDFKDLYAKLSAGRLAWVLRTGLPLHTAFKIWLDGQELSSSKAQLKTIDTYRVGSEKDTVADAMKLDKGADGVSISWY